MNDVLPEIVNDPDLIVETDEEEELLAPDVTEVVREIDTEEVFEKPKKKSATTKIVPVKKEPKPKRQISEEHKAKLAAAREKALATRRAKAAEKKKLKDLENKVNEKQKVEKIKKLEDTLNDVPPPRQAQKAEIDEAVIQRAIEEALTKQEMARQKRKAQKKAKQEEEIAKAKAQEAIRQAVYPAKLYAGDQGFASKYIYNMQ